MKATFAVRDENGSLCVHSSSREFLIEPLHQARVHGQVATRALRPRTNGPAPSTALVRVRPDANSGRPHEAPRFVRERPRRRKRSRLRWLWSIPIAAVLFFGGLLVKERYLTSPPQPVSMGLRLEEDNGQLRIVWDKSATPVAAAGRAIVEIVDGGKSQSFPLDPERLKQGLMMYERKSGDVKVKLSVFPPNGKEADAEMAQFVGPTPGDAQSLERQRRAWAKERASLQAEIKRLRSQLGRESSRNQELQNRIRELQDRLNKLPSR